MAGNQFYVRVRGKISGPFDLAGLQKLAKRGSLSRVHEVSTDRLSWDVAGGFEDLFPAAPSRVSAVVEPGIDRQGIDQGIDDARFPIAQPAGILSGSGQLYFYTQRGSTVGPVPMSVLKSLADNGTLQPDDLVWRENAETGVDAAQMPALAPLFAGGGSKARLDYGRPGVRRSSIHPSSFQTAEATASKQAQSVGVAAGSLLLLLINLPWFSVGSNANKRLVCWWDLYRAPEGNGWAMLATFMVAVGMVCCIVSPTLRGLARSILFLSMMAGVWLFTSVAMLGSNAHPQAVVALFVPLIVSLLVGVCAFRASAPESDGGRTMLAVCSAFVVFAMFYGTIISIEENRLMGDVPAGVIFGYVVICLALLSGVAAGVMGLVALKPQFNRSLNTATIITSLASLILPGVGILCVSLALADYGGYRLRDEFSSEASSMVLGILLRILAIFYACLALIIVGIRELFTASYLVQLKR